MKSKAIFHKFDLIFKQTIVHLDQKLELLRSKRVKEYRCKLYLAFKLIAVMLFPLLAQFCDHTLVFLLDESRKLLK